jgi:hypothetical protein
MVARFLYRLASLFFFVLALMCWLLTAFAVYAQLSANGFNPQAFFIGVMSPVFAFIAHQASIEAWRAARIRYRSPLWRDYP